MALLELPVECQLAIMESLSVQDVLALARTCKGGRNSWGVPWLACASIPTQCMWHAPPTVADWDASTPALLCWNAAAHVLSSSDAFWSRLAERKWGSAAARLKPADTPWQRFACQRMCLRSIRCLHAAPGGLAGCARDLIALQ